MIPHEHSEIAEIHCLIVPMIIGETQRNYSEFIAFLLWRIPQIMSVAVREYNAGQRMPIGTQPTPTPEPDDPPLPDLVFTGAKVNTWVLTVRKGPDKSYKIIRYLLKGMIISIYEESHGWANISFGGNEWVSSTYLTPL